MPDITPPPATPPANTPAPDHAKDIADLKAQNAALLARLDKLAPATPPADDPSLMDKIKKENDLKAQKAGDTKALEAALKFNINSAEFLKANQSLLPKEISDLFAAADKETYGSAIEKDQAIKAGMVQSFFALQANIDLLTPGLKSQLEDFLKLTKTGKQERAQQIYDSIFEPTFDMLKRIKKAEQLSKGGGQTTDADDQYKNKMIALSKEHYLGVKQ